MALNHVSKLAIEVLGILPPRKEDQSADTFLPSEFIQVIKNTDIVAPSEMAFNDPPPRFFLRFPRPSIRGGGRVQIKKNGMVQMFSTQTSS